MVSLPAQQKISIVPPSYPQGRFLEASRCSVLAQDSPDIEYSLDDGGSKDNRVEMIGMHKRGTSVVNDDLCCPDRPRRFERGVGEKWAAPLAAKINDI